MRFAERGLGLVAGILLAATVAQALDYRASAAAVTPQVDSVAAAAAAKAWQLTDLEWQRYQTLMRGPRGVWSPDLDPLTVLGIHAETAAERSRYAELLVTLEYQRVEQELAFQRAYTQAAARLFPDLLPLQPVNAAP